VRQVVDVRRRDLLQSQPVLIMRLPPDASQIVSQVIKASAHAGDERKIFMLVLRGMQALFACRAGAIFLYRRSGDALHKVKAVGDMPWDTATLLSFYHNLKPELPAEVIMAPVRRGQEVVGVMALVKHEAFDRGAGRIATEVLKTVGGALGDRRRLAILDAEAAIARSMLAGLDPKDVTYRIFHQLRRFMDYDHSATLWQWVAEGQGRIAARQVAWTKGRSGIVGMTAPFPWDDLAGLRSPVILGEGGGSRAGERVWETIRSVSEPSEPPRRSALLCLLGASDRMLGCVIVASGRSDFFLDKDVRLLSSFELHLSRCLEQSHTDPGGCHE
jgi:hypothetical protein